MTFLQTLTTIFELGMVVALFWCFFHEDRLITFEKKIMAHFRRRKMRVVTTKSYHATAKARQ